MKKIRGDKPMGVTIHTYMEIPQGNSLHSHLYLKQTKMSTFSFYLFSFTKLENRRAEQILPRGEGWHLWEGGGNGESG
jgi:hypothetical protein